MSHDRPSEIEGNKPAVEQCLLIGAPVLAGLLLLCAQVGWAVAGKAPEFSPTQWVSHSIALAASISLGVFAVLAVVAVLWGLGSLAVMLGGAIIGSYRRWRYR
ncbi:hypothetical protein B0E52_09915 [Rhodanobacter sp. C06]|uniref:hypothetical protein n=1 Tax=Rhodanobacter sp. C06 TaxID=1945854 RepID=UPI000984E47A|nr:hypothetical protein [Rhodanobacter sp. C06]OOG42310.1 hypothetical protein B0E52_09915 [Rhodanobacter sp. C06]